MLVLLVPSWLVDRLHFFRWLPQWLSDACSRSYWLLFTTLEARSFFATPSSQPESYMGQLLGHTRFFRYLLVRAAASERSDAWSKAN